jgi:hypothetical protein
MYFELPRSDDSVAFKQPLRTKTLLVSRLTCGFGVANTYFPWAHQPQAPAFRRGVLDSVAPPESIEDKIFPWHIHNADGRSACSDDR